MESMLEILNECLQDSNVETVSKGELRKKYLEKLGLRKLPHEDKKLFVSAVNTAYLNYIAHKTTTDDIADKTKIDEASDAEMKKNSEDWKLEMSSSSDEITPENVKEDIIDEQFTNGENDIKETSGDEMTENGGHKELVMDFCPGDNTSHANIQENDIEMDSSSDFDEKSLASFQAKIIKKSSPAALTDSSKKPRGKRTLLSSSEDESIQLKPTKKSKALKKARRSNDLEAQHVGKSEEKKKSVKNENRFKKAIVESSDSEDEPLVVFQKKSNSSYKSLNSATKSDESENECLSKFMKKKFSNPVDSEDETFMSSTNQKTKSINDSINHLSDSEAEPLVKLNKPNSIVSNGKKKEFETKQKSNGSMKSRTSSSDSENESLAIYTKCNDSIRSEKNSNSFTKKKLNSSSKFAESIENTSESEDESLAKYSKKKVNNSFDSDDEPLTNLSKKSDSMNNSFKSVKNASDSENESLNSLSFKKTDISNNYKKEKIVKDKMKHSLKKKRFVDSDDDFANISDRKKGKTFDGQKNSLLSDSSEDEPLSSMKKKPKNSIYSEDDANISNRKKEKSFDGQKNSLLSDSSEDEPLSNIKKKPNNSSDSEDEPLNKLSTKKSYKKRKNSESGSSSFVDENEDHSNKIKSSKKKEDNHSGKQGKKRPSASENKIEHLKKYLRVAGIRISNYNKLFENCKSMKAKCEKMMSLLEKEGLKGRPTLEKCKKLRVKIETKREIAELDMSNILKVSGGRPKRSVCLDPTNCTPEEKSTPIKKFSRLQGIVDSEESD